MKKYLRVSLFSTLMLFCGLAFSYTNAQFTNWHYTMSQTQRNNAILAMANAQPQRVTAGAYCNCYNWANSMLMGASNSVMQFPLTLPDGSGWYAAAWIQPWAFTTVTGTIPAVRDAYPGHVVQMITKYGDGTWGPHTAIVHHTDATSVWFIDANYTGCQVTLHQMTWAYFNSHVTKYTINVIN